MSFIDNLGYFTVGKHTGRFVGEIIREDPAYAREVLVSCRNIVSMMAGANLDAPSPPVPPVPPVPYSSLFSPLPLPPPPLPPEALEIIKKHQAEKDVSETMSLIGPSRFEATVSSLRPTPRPMIVWTDEQNACLDEVENWMQGRESFFALTGPAGTGKTTVAREIIARYPHAQLTAMTGKAALRLSEVAGMSASTLHKILYYPPKGGESVKFTRLREPISSLVVVDEASMMTPSVFADTERWALQGIRFLLIGDSYQLPPVITGDEARKHGDDYSVFSQVRGTALKTVMRNAGGVLRAATKVRETGEICTESDYSNGEGYEFFRERDPVQRAVDEYLADRDDHILVTWKNAVRMKANKMIRATLGHDGPLPDEGEPVLIKKNSAELLNGEIVTCQGFDVGPTIGSVRTLYMKFGFNQRVLISFEGGNPEKGGEPFDGTMPWIQDWKKYHKDLDKLGVDEPIPVTFGYVLTCHAAQGSEARRATVFLNKGDDRNTNFRKPTTLPGGRVVPASARWLYTSQTRSKKYTVVIVGR